MSQEFSELNFSDDLQEVLALPDASRWKIEKTGGLEILVMLYSVTTPKELFQARLLWQIYPEQPPSVKFMDPSSGRLDLRTAWPRVRGFRPDNFDICATWTVEGFTTHPEWVSDPGLRWKSNGNVLLKVLRTLQDEMDYYFEGRQD